MRRRCGRARAAALHTTAVGDLFPGHGGASGHAIFAFLAESRVRTLFGETLERYSPSTATTIDELLAIYAEVRRTGIATSHGEYDARVTAVAAPVFARGVATGAISVIGPRESMRNHLDAVVPPLRRTAEQISALLTGPPPGEPHTTEGAPSLAARLPGELLTRGRD
ncbi:MAG TPA: IclR family transcriptional regulator C-terminal domain-containing protein [Pseudonocardia sp.]|uniref:IclR family transcriptional regulator domain-containing protein n=1 Tax=Pseudonocardia sp. TaxID=60912 RepID=UPI002EDA0B0D